MKVVRYILTDHLGSTSMMVYEDEQEAIQVKAQQWYKPWGETREVWGVLPTDRTFQGRLDWGREQSPALPGADPKAGRSCVIQA